MLHLLLILGCADATGDGDTSAVVGDADAGGVLYSETCAGCHNADGSGGNDINGTLSADHRVRVPEMTDAELEEVIRNGKNTAMPGQYSDDQDVADVIAYLRATFQ